MYLNTAGFHPLTAMGFSGGPCAGPTATMGSPMLAMMAMQQQCISMMMSLISSLFQGGFGGGNMLGAGGLPALGNFGGGGFGGGGLAGVGNFLGGGVGGTRKGNGNGKFGSTPSQPGGSSKFNVASFNVLGSSHTAAGGNKAERPSGVSRMRGAVAAMKSHNIDIAGMQEFQGDQQKAFKQAMPNFGVYGDKDNAVVWNKEKFKLVDKKTFTIPYFEGQPRKMPVVKLQDKMTGKQMWVVTVHNPADTKNHPRNAHNRARAVAIEQNLVRQLRASGLPVIVTGDFNDAKSIDHSMARVGMHSAAPRKAASAIDYIFGSNGITFSNYSKDTRTQKNGTSDHPIIVSTARI